MKRILQVLISLVLFGLLVYFVDFKQIGKSISNAKYSYFAAALFTIICNRIIMGSKWKLLLDIKNIHVSLLECTKIYYIANFLGLFLPPTIGTDLVRSYYVARNDNNSTPDVLASIFIERVLGFIVLFVSAIFGFIILEYAFIEVHFNKTKMFHFILLLTVVGIILFILSFNKRFRKLFLQIAKPFCRKKTIDKVIRKVNDFTRSYQGYKYHKKGLIIFLVLTFCEVFTYILWSYYTALALNVEINLIYFVAFVPITLVFIRLPISLDGFGIQESLYVYFLMQIGVSQSLGFSVGFITHIITIIGILPGGIFYAFNKRGKEIRSKIEVEEI